MPRSQCRAREIQTLPITPQVVRYSGIWAGDLATKTSYARHGRIGADLSRIVHRWALCSESGDLVRALGWRDILSLRIDDSFSRGPTKLRTSAPSELPRPARRRPPSASRSTPAMERAGRGSVRRHRSVIHTAELPGKNAHDYLTAIASHSDDVASRLDACLR